MWFRFQDRVVSFRTKAELEKLLLDGFEVTKGGVFWDGLPVNLDRTYEGNCVKPGELAAAILPGFSPQAFQINPEYALANLKQFAK